MSQLERQRHDEEVLQTLIDAIKKRDGAPRVEELQAELRDRIQRGMMKEALLQLLAKERFWNRTRFLLLYPEYIVPYLFRVK